MFRKPKRSSKKAGFRARKKPDDDDVNNDDEEDRETSQELQEALKRAKHEHNNNSKSSKSKTSSNNDDDSDDKNAVMHQFENKNTGGLSIKDLATSTQQHHPKEMETISKSQSLVDPTRNKFLAAPIRAPTNIRTTCRFDYQPDICKDYKDTGFCGFGDTCIYLHDRGDTMAGWQLEKVWEEKQKSKQNLKDKQIKQFLNKHNGDNFDNSENENNADAPPAADGDADNDDGLPFACFICRKAFDEPIVTPCGHYFCQDCLQGNANTDVNNDGGQKCPICSQETHGVMNQPTKLITKKRKLLGRNSTWQEFMDASSKSKSGDDDE